MPEKYSWIQVCQLILKFHRTSLLIPVLYTYKKACAVQFLSINMKLNSPSPPKKVRAELCLVTSYVGESEVLSFNNKSYSLFTAQAYKHWYFIKSKYCGIFCGACPSCSSTSVKNFSRAKFTNNISLGNGNWWATIMGKTQIPGQQFLF